MVTFFPSSDYSTLLITVGSFLDMLLTSNAFIVSDVSKVRKHMRVRSIKGKFISSYPRHLN